MIFSDAFKYIDSIYSFGDTPSIRFSMGISEIDRVILSIETYDKNKLKKLLLQYQKNTSSIELCTKAFIQPSNYSSYIKGDKKPSAVTLILLCLYYKLSFEESDELLKAGGYNIGCTTSIPMVVFNYFLINNIYDVGDYYTCCTRYAEMKGEALKDPFFSSWE